MDSVAVELTHKIADFAVAHGLRIAAAESLTSGLICAELGAAPRASDWFVGGVVAYDAQVKSALLGVDPGPVVTARCAEQMKAGVVRLLRADYAVAVTGVGGPDEEEGKPPGRVYICSGGSETTLSRECDLSGSPEEILKATVRHAIQALWDGMQETTTH